MNHAVRHQYAPTPEEPISVEEYLAFERTSTVKHEYVDGWLHAMAGAHKRHDTIVVNLTAALLPATRDGLCEFFTSDVKVRVSDTRFYYPDLSVVCQPDDEDDTSSRDRALSLRSCRHRHPIRIVARSFSHIAASTACGTI